MVVRLLFTLELSFDTFPLFIAFVVLPDVLPLRVSLSSFAVFAVLSRRCSFCDGTALVMSSTVDFASDIDDPSRINENEPEDVFFSSASYESLMVC